MSSIMVQGTSSSAGKSLLVTGLCRVFKEDGFKVAPFKSQNMSSKFYESSQGKKFSSAQALQALAAGKEASEKMNPILLKPSSDKGSNLIILGEDQGHMDAKEYFKLKKSLKPLIEKTYWELAKDQDIMVIEGAGSPAEINLKENDIVNMGMAEIADAPVILIADIDRGGVFASLYGTVMLLEPDERARIKGLVINKFRGDKELLDPGIDMIEELLGIPVIGTIPFTSLELIDEDSLIDYDKACNHREQTYEEINRELEKWSKVLRENLDLDYIYSLVGLKL